MGARRLLYTADGGRKATAEEIDSSEQALGKRFDVLEAKMDKRFDGLESDVGEIKALLTKDKQTGERMAE